MGIFSSFNINSSGLTAQRYRMDIISQNLANANTTRADGSPYRRKVVVFEEKNSQTPFSRVLNKATDRYSGTGVKVSSVQEDNWTDMIEVYDPSHPDADEDGYVMLPNVNRAEEQIDLMAASNAYVANLTVLEVIKSMAMKTLEIGK